MKLIHLILIFTLSACGAGINLAHHSKPTSYTRSSNSIFIKNPDKIKTIYIVLKNYTSYDSFSEISKNIYTKLNGKYEIAKNIEDADLVFYLNIRHFSQMKNKTMENIEKYWQYYDTSDSATMKEINPNSFAISDESVAVTDIQNGAKPTTVSRMQDDGIITKITQNDFISGMTLGGFMGFWIAHSNPIGATIGAMIGGATSFTAQSATLPKTYMSTVDIEISQKMNFTINYEEKYIHKQDDNGMRWHSLPTSNNRNYSRIKMYAVVTKAMLSDINASQMLAEKLTNAISNGI